ncbi:MAG: TonB-dependent receptor [Rhodobiaceae bacterium]|nr:TonB-dependent receptor [Rhodobiaceae bacterium]
MGLGYRVGAALFTGVAIGSILAGAAHAQQAPAPQGQQDQQTGNDTGTTRGTTVLQKLVVGAGVEKVAIDTPQAVTVVDQEALDEEQADTVGEAMDFVPGVQGIGSDRPAGQSYNIRGIGDFAAADESKIIVNIDGATKFHEQYRLGSLFTDPELYKQIEILRGPASSTLYGSGAYGGVINLVTKDAGDFLQPGDRMVVRLKSSFDSNPGGFLASALAAIQATESTELLIQGNMRDFGDYRNGSGVVIGGSNYETFSGLVKSTTRFGDNDEQELRLSYERWQNSQDNAHFEQTGTTAPFPTSPFSPFLGVPNPFGTIDREITDQTVVMSYKNPDSDNPWIDLNVNLSWSKTKVFQHNWQPGEPILAGDVLFEDAEYGNETWQAKVDNTFEHFGANFENYLTVGAAYVLQDRIAYAQVSKQVPFHPQGQESEVGLFAQNEFVWNQKLTVITGVRADFATIDPDPAIVGANQHEFTAVSPKVAAAYKFTENFSVFGSVAGTERAPTIDELYTVFPVPLGGCRPGDTRCFPGGATTSAGLRPESAINYELGFTVSTFDLFTLGDSLQVKTTAFRNDIEDLIALNPDNTNASPVPYYVNIDRATIKGIEVEAAYESEKIFGRFAFSNIQGIDRVSGLPLDTIPATSVVASLGGYLPEHGVKYGWKGTFVSTSKDGAVGPTPGYVLHDVFVGWKPEAGALAGFEFLASVENIFDKQYRNNLDNEDGMGRTFKLTVARQFAVK